MAAHSRVALPVVAGYRSFTQESYRRHSMVKRVYGFALLIAVLAGTALAQQAQPPLPADAPSREEVMQFLELMNMKDQVKQMQAMMAQQFQAEMTKDFKKHTPGPTPEQQKQMVAAMTEMFNSI